jgi:hypothetical protein
VRIEAETYHIKIPGYLAVDIQEAVYLVHLGVIYNDLGNRIEFESVV